jgi:hypothetical protein
VTSVYFRHAADEEVVVQGRHARVAGRDCPAASARKFAAEGLQMHLVDVKVCSVDDIWSGLKLVILKEHR